MKITAEIDEPDLKRIVDKHLSDLGHSVKTINFEVVKSDKTYIKCHVELEGEKAKPSIPGDYPA